MTNEEILRDWNQSKDRTKQIEILADLNCTDKAEIVDVLRRMGVPPEELPVVRRKKKQKSDDNEHIECVANYIAEMLKRKKEIKTELERIDEEIARVRFEIFGEMEEAR